MPTSDQCSGSRWLFILAGCRPGKEEEGGKIFALKIGESKEYKPTEVAAKVDGFDLSANKKKLLIFYRNNTLAIADADGSKVEYRQSKTATGQLDF